MKYYHCINCGYHGEFEFYRQRNIACESCNYEHITEYDETDWKESGYDLKHIKNKADKYYDGHLKYGPSRHAAKQIKDEDNKI